VRAHSVVAVTRVIGAVLAAGGGTRMGAPKAELTVDGARLLDRAVGALRGGGCAEVLAVVRPGTSVCGASIVVNERPEHGMRSSLALAVDAVYEHCDALVVLLVDTPGVTAAAVSAVVGGWRPGRVAVASYTGRRGHPVVMSPQLWGAAVESAGDDEGARAFLALRPELVDEIPVQGDPTDLDTPADLARWAARRNRGAGAVE
jgi:CTP:molybdopterin cytidylyltransferase MocA